MFQTLLHALPFGHNAKVLLGVMVICGASYVPMYMRRQTAVGYDTMAEKREAQRKAAAAAQSGDASNEK
jgi:hypothetical protein